MPSYVLTSSYYIAILVWNGVLLFAKDAYKRYFCWVNFPRCDEFEETLPMCQSVCENFFRVCGYDNDLWMCQNNMIDNGDDMEVQRKSNPSSSSSDDEVEESSYISLVNHSRKTNMKSRKEKMFPRTFARLA